MKKIIILGAVALMAVAQSVTEAWAQNQDSLAIVNAEWSWKSEGADIQYGQAEVTIFGRRQLLSVIRYNTKKTRTSIFTSIRDRAGATSTLAKKAGALAAVNGSFFNMKELTPVTFVKEEGVECGADDPRRLKVLHNGMLLVKGKKSRKLDVVSCYPSEYEKVTKGVLNAIVAGPTLIEDGKCKVYTADTTKVTGEVILISDKGFYDDFYEERHPRTVVGYKKDGMAYLIVVDGRFPQYDGVSIDETTLIAKYFGLYEALNLDGGGSSTMWTKSGGVINYPCDNELFDHEGERTVPNILILK